MRIIQSFGHSNSGDSHPVVCAKSLQCFCNSLSRTKR